MKLSEIKAELNEHPEKLIQFVLPTGTRIPVHAHVTEVARVEKRFVDCGGTFRTVAHCGLQVWLADDTEHRISAKKLLKALTKASPLLEGEDMDVEVECETPFVSQFPVVSTTVEENLLMVRLGLKHTACLAPDVCLPPVPRVGIDFKPLPSFQKTKCC